VAFCGLWNRFYIGMNCTVLGKVARSRALKYYILDSTSLIAPAYHGESSVPTRAGPFLALSASSTNELCTPQMLAELKDLVQKGVFTVVCPLFYILAARITDIRSPP
jgi:hypothetical protein